MSHTTFDFFPLSASRFSEPAKYEGGECVMDAITLHYGKQPKVGWRFVVEQAGFNVVGLVYPTKAELLADLPSYAESWGFPA